MVVHKEDPGRLVFIDKLPTCVHAIFQISICVLFVNRQFFHFCLKISLCTTDDAKPSLEHIVGLNKA
jgi:hypothetical protein